MTRPVLGDDHLIVKDKDMGKALAVIADGLDVDQFLQKRLYQASGKQKLWKHGDKLKKSLCWKQVTNRKKLKLFSKATEALSKKMPKPVPKAVFLQPLPNEMPERLPSTADFEKRLAKVQAWAKEQWENPQDSDSSGSFGPKLPEREAARTRRERRAVAKAKGESERRQFFAPSF